eukprot:NODE_27_length_39007_cov_1.590650.p1 type:complete len:1018 gc:universal NODE_27_length_39007_cov_1.590650:24135-21082(-)
MHLWDHIHVLQLRYVNKSSSFFFSFFPSLQGLKMFAWINSSILINTKSNSVSCVCMNENKFIGLTSGTILVINSNHEIQELVGHKEEITSIECYGEYLASGDSSGLLIIWKFYQNAYYEEMSNHKNLSKVVSIAFRTYLAIAYSDGQIIVGTGLGQLNWGIQLRDLSIKDCKWLDSNLLILTDSPCQIVKYDWTGVQLGTFLLNIQNPVKFLFNTGIELLQTNLKILIKTEKTIYGCSDLDLNKVIDFGVGDDMIFIKNNILICRKGMLQIYNQAGSLSSQLNLHTTNEQFLMSYGGTLASVSLSQVLFLKYRCHHRVIYDTGILYYEKNIMDKSCICVYTPLNFKTIRVAGLSAFHANDSFLVFCEIQDGKSKVTIADKIGRILEIVEIKENVLEVSICKSFLGFITKNHYFIYKSTVFNFNQPTIFYVDNIVRKIEFKEFKFPNATSVECISCVSYREVLYVLFKGGQVSGFDIELKQLFSYELECGEVKNLIKFEVKFGQLGLLLGQTLHVYDLNPFKAKFKRPNVLDFKFNEDFGVCCIEKQKLVIVNSESIIIDGDYLAEFTNYIVRYFSYEQLPNNFKPVDVFKYYFTEFSSIIDKESPNVSSLIPNEALNLYKQIGIKFLNQNKIDEALSCFIKAKSKDLMKFCRLLMSLSKEDLAIELLKYFKKVDEVISTLKHKGDFNDLCLYLIQTKSLEKLAPYLNLIQDNSIRKICFKNVGINLKKKGSFLEASKCFDSISEYELSAQCLLSARKFDQIKHSEIPFKYKFQSGNYSIIKVDSPTQLLELKTNHIYQKLTYEQHNDITYGNIYTNVKFLFGISMYDKCLQQLESLNYEDLLSNKKLAFLKGCASNNFTVCIEYHYFYKALLNYKNEYYSETLKLTTPCLLSRTLPLLTVILLRGLSAFNLKLYAISSACFGLLRSKDIYITCINLLTETFSRNNSESCDLIDCVHCNAKSNISSTCSNCTMKIEFDDKGTICKSGIRCSRCKVLLSSNWCSVCHLKQPLGESQTDK